MVRTVLEFHSIIAFPVVLRDVFCALNFGHQLIVGVAVMRLIFVALFPLFCVVFPMVFQPMRKRISDREQELIPLSAMSRLSLPGLQQGSCSSGGGAVSSTRQ